MIDFTPDNLVSINEDWAKIFNKTYMEELEDEEERERLAEGAAVITQVSEDGRTIHILNKYLSITFIQNTDEAIQDSFSYDLTRYDQAGLMIELKFSEPLTVSAGD